MFIDKAKVKAQAGKGGDGLVSFRQEKFVDKGGPNGGDGGKGGDIILRASWNVQSLAAFRYNPLLKAEHGGNGDQSDCHGRNGKKLIVDVPVGTVVYLDQNPIADMSTDGQLEVLARGGKGGFGNAHFKSSVRQTPRVAEIGERGDYLEVTFELKMLADVGLVGMPNAGKSTLLSVVSSAKPKIANYPFTTLDPNIGLGDVDNERFLMADIPGIIEGASEGKGLGSEFLRHIERTKVLLHLVDANSNDPGEDYKVIRNELATYSPELLKRDSIVILSKTDGLDADIIAMQVKSLKDAVKSVKAKNVEVLSMSAKTHDGIKELMYKVKDLVMASQAKVAAEEQEKSEAVTIIKLIPRAEDWKVAETTKGYLVTGHKIEKFAERTRFGEFHAEQRLRDIMKKKCITRELSRRGAKGTSDIMFGRSGLYVMHLISQGDETIL
jgi:GTPase